MSESHIKGCSGDGNSPFGSAGNLNGCIHVPGGMFRAKPGIGGTIISASLSSAKIFGCDSVDEFLLLKLGDLFVNPALCGDIFGNSGIGKQIFEGCCEMKRKDGGRFWATVFVSALESECGGVCCLLFAVVEMTEPNRLMTELELQKAVGYELSRAASMKEALDSLIDISLRIDSVDGGGIYLVDEDRRMYSLAAWKNLSDDYVELIRDIPLESPIATVLQELKPVYMSISDFPPSIQEIMLKESLKAVSSVPIVHNGAILAVFNLASRTLDTFPRDTRYVIESISYEIGEVIARIQAENDILVSRERYRYLIENISDVIYRVDAENEEFDYLSPNIEELTGYSRNDIAEMGGRVSFMKKIIGPAFEEKRIRFHGLKTAKKNPQIETIENWITAKDGSRRYIQDRWRALYYNDAFIGTGGALRDITEFKRIEEELQRAHNLESLGVLAGGIAHDFNNILTAIMGNISLVMAEDSIPKDSLGILLEAENACSQAKNLTAQLLTFSKGGSPVKSLKSLPDIISNATAFYLRGSGVTCSYRFADGLWSAEIDEGQIGQVLQNLVINAGQAMQDGGEITISADNLVLKTGNILQLESGNYVRISVSDTGAGIRPEDIKRIYDPYFTTKKSGHGLGLSITYSIVRRHSGTITVDSTPGYGSTFTVYLPASQESAGTTAPAPAVEPQYPLRVLVMDDEPGVRRVLSRMLGRLGHEVVDSIDGDDAIGKFRLAMEAGTPFDSVIMDLTIPGGMGGREAVAKIHDIDPSACVLVSSGYSSDPVIADYRNFGFSGFISKPFRLEELLEALECVGKRSDL